MFLAKKLFSNNVTSSLASYIETEIDITEKAKAKAVDTLAA
jgi:hypothetical protein